MEEPSSPRSTLRTMLVVAAIALAIVVTFFFGLNYSEEGQSIGVVPTEAPSQ